MHYRAYSCVLVVLGSVAVAATGANDQVRNKLAPAELFAQTSPAIVRVYCYDEQGVLSGQGTGFFVSEDGKLVTNYHVVRGGVSWQVILGDERSFDVVAVMHASPEADLAILQVKGRWFPYLELSGDQLPAPGEKVIAIGNPLGLTNTISDGLLSGYRDRAGRPRMLQISAPISSGSSGGPLFVDGDARVVGVTTSAAGIGQNLNFAVPAREVNKLLRARSAQFTPKPSSTSEELWAAVESGSLERLQSALKPEAKSHQWASTTVYGEDEDRYFNWEFDAKSLVDGRNVLAVEVHQRGPTSSDLGFDLQLIGNPDAPVVLVPQGATWKYIDDGSDQPSVWRRAEFDDSHWKSGTAKFGFGDEAVTVVSYGADENNKHITTYFRHTFDLDSAAGIKRLVLSLLRDDGAVVYLNGVPVVVDNVDIELDVDAADGEGRTALHLAAADGKEAAVRLLLDAGSWPNRPTPSGATALDLAIENGHDKVVASLRQRGGLSSAQLQDLMSAFAAVQRGDIDQLATLVDNGVNVNWQDGSGATALHHAVYAAQEAMVEWLLNKGADVNRADMYGYRPLHVAVIHERVPLIQRLLDGEADVQVFTKHGNTCLLDACQIGSPDVVALLLDKGAPLHARSESTGKTVLHHALRHDRVLKLLLERGASVNALDRSGATPLLAAARAGLLDATELLRQYKGRVSVPLGIRTRLPKFRADVMNSIGMPLKLIPPGQFTMGSPPAEKGRATHETEHSVTITKGFLIGVTEVTIEQFEMFIVETGYQPYSTANDQANADDNSAGYSWRRSGIEQAWGHPVVYVSWRDAVEFCKWLSQREGKTYRLPTEAEWEYACRAGTTTPYYNGHSVNELKASGWFKVTSFFAFSLNAQNDRTLPAGSLLPNAWGLYDMHGNVSEWTADRFSEYSSQAVTDPQVNQGSDLCVIRGGSWNSRPGECRSASRDAGDPDVGESDLGFRVVLNAQ